MSTTNLLLDFIFNIWQVHKHAKSRFYLDRYILLRSPTFKKMTHQDIIFSVNPTKYPSSLFDQTQNSFIALNYSTPARQHFIASKNAYYQQLPILINLNLALSSKPCHCCTKLKGKIQPCGKWKLCPNCSYYKFKALKSSYPYKPNLKFITINPSFDHYSSIPMSSIPDVWNDIISYVKAQPFNGYLLVEEFASVSLLSDKQTPHIHLIADIHDNLSDDPRFNIKVDPITSEASYYNHMGYMLKHINLAHLYNKHLHLCPSLPLYNRLYKNAIDQLLHYTKGRRQIRSYGTFAKKSKNNLFASSQPTIDISAFIHD